MAAGLEHGMSKLLRMMHKKDKSSQDQARQQFKVEPFTSGQANAPASSSSRPFNPTASAPAAFISERSRTPPGMVTTIGHAPVSDSRRAGTPPYSHRARTPPANHPSHSRSHAHSQSQSLANHSALAGVGNSTNAHQYKAASSSGAHAPPQFPHTAPHHIVSFSGGPSRPQSPPAFPPASAPHHTTSFGGSSGEAAPSRTAHSRPGAFHRPSTPAGSAGLHQPFGPEAHAATRAARLGQVSPYAQMNRSTSEVGHLPVYHGSLDLGQALRNGYYNSAEDLTVGGGPPLRTRTPLANTQHPPPHAQQQQTPQQRHSPSLHGRSLPAGPAHIPVPSTSRPRDALQKTSSSGSSRSDAHMPPPGVDYEDLDLVRRDPFAARDQLHQRMASSERIASGDRRPSDGSPSRRPAPVAIFELQQQEPEVPWNRAQHAIPPKSPPPTSALPPTPERHPSSLAVDRAPTPKRGPAPAHITTASAAATTTSTRPTQHAPTPSQIAYALNGTGPAVETSTDDARKGKAPVILPLGPTPSVSKPKIQPRQSRNKQNAAFGAVAGPMGMMGMGMTLVTHEPTPRKPALKATPPAPGPEPHTQPPVQQISTFAPPPAGFGVAHRRRVPPPAALQSTAPTYDALPRTPPATAALPHVYAPRSPPSFSIAHPTPPPTGSFASLLPPQTPRTALIADALATGMSIDTLLVGGRERPLPPVPISPLSAGSVGISPGIQSTVASPIASEPVTSAMEQSKDKVLDISQAAYNRIEQMRVPPATSSPLAQEPILPSPHSPLRRASSTPFHPSGRLVSPRRNVFFQDDTAIFSPSPLTGGAGTTLMTPYSARFSSLGTPYSGAFGGGDESPLGPPPSIASDSGWSPGSKPEPVRPAMRSVWAPRTPRTPKRSTFDDGLDVPPLSSVSSPSPAVAYPPEGHGAVPVDDAGSAAEGNGTSGTSEDETRPKARRRASSLDSVGRRKSRWGATTPAKTRFVDPPAAFRPPSSAVQVPVFSLHSQQNRAQLSATPADDLVVIGMASPGPLSAVSAKSTGSDRSAASSKLSIDTSVGRRAAKRADTLNVEEATSALATDGATGLTPGVGTMLPSALEAHVMAAHPVLLGAAPAAAVRLSSLSPPMPTRRATSKTPPLPEAIAEETLPHEDADVNDIDSPLVNRHPHHPRKTGTSGRRTHPKSRTVTTLWTELWQDVHSHADAATSSPPVPLATISGSGMLPMRQAPAGLLSSPASGQPINSPALPTLDFGSPLSVTFDSPRSLLSMGGLGGMFLSPSQSMSAGVSPGSLLSGAPLSGISSGAESSPASALAVSSVGSISPSPSPSVSASELSPAQLR